ncbi:hypothetical protein [Occultella gossypii]|uniref:Uncharacterized protein n=1 Tax=Occultella gossypii TaxID=2800820 RepID=A0ABS7SJM7_9MICO|nr:hypothetical protein [Occultella gossypii]MBZ2199493.1 hypothetical protein [Occultella gossypii]
MPLAPTVPDAEDFRALARSSPWRWRIVRFTAEWTGPYAGAAVRAWIERPNRIRVETLGGREVLDERQDVGSSTGFVIAFDAEALAQEPELADPAYRSRTAGDRYRDVQARRLAETLVDDAGLVRRRTTNRDDHDAPMYQNYHWVAMLDPIELTDGSEYWHDPEDPDGPGAGGVDGVVPGTVIDEVRTVDHEGRPAWEAVLRTTAAYDPRCSCCALLPNEATDIADNWRNREGDYADAFRVRLDVDTGICVFTEEVGGERAGAGHSVRLESVGRTWGPEDPPWRTG